MDTRSSATLWSMVEDGRYFLVPDGFVLQPGPLLISNALGESVSVQPGSLDAFEVTEDQARAWAKKQLGQTLDELKQGIDEKLADWRQKLDEFNKTPVSKGSTVTPNTASALFDLLKRLPRVIGNSLSTDEQRVESAKATIADLQRRLKDAGIDLDDRFTNFPDRLAELRKDFEQQRRAKKTKADSSPPDKP